MASVNDPNYKIAEHKFWSARGLEHQVKEQNCNYCNIMDTLAYSRIVGKYLCKKCFIASYLIYLEYQDKLNLWKKES